MRLAIYILGIWLLAGTALAADPPWLELESTNVIEWRISELADWHSPRFFSGIGWELGTASREASDVMTGGYTVIDDVKAGHIALKHCYVLAAFDIIPSRHLVVCIRDPEHYWSGYDIDFGVTDPIDLVWYDDQWEEYAYITLDYSSMERPDEFMMDDRCTCLLAINKALSDEDRIDPGGHWLNLISLRDGIISDVLLPEVDGMGNLPTAWLPVLMHFQDDGRLQVQAGNELRLYEVRWD